MEGPQKITECIIESVRILRPELNLDHFFGQLPKADSSLLLLDYDGTLAPFVEDPSVAVPYPGVIDRLERLLQTKTRLVIVTGRSVDDLFGLIGLARRLEIWGSHGQERHFPDGRKESQELDAKSRRALRKAEEKAVEHGGDGWLERKPLSLALHFRGRPAAQVVRMKDEVKPFWQSLADNTSLVLHHFDGGIELRLEGENKGTAVRTLLEEMTVTTPAAYLGDDLTDEDAFEALNGQGLTVLVRPDFRPTRAQLWIQPPEELLQLLDRWITGTS